jgi:hypothetical protein
MLNSERSYACQNKRLAAKQQNVKTASRLYLPPHSSYGLWDWSVTLRGPSESKSLLSATSAVHSSPWLAILYLQSSSVLCYCIIQSPSVKTKLHIGRLGGVVVNVLATGPKGRGFKHGRSDGFITAIQIRSTPSFGWEVKPEVPCRKILRHVKDPLRYFRYW